jgi:hypothetical protein
MVAAAPLGDVVEQGGEIEQPALVEAGHEARAERILVGELRHGKAPQVAHHLQDVLVHGVDVEQVVLHLADDAAEGRQVAAEDVVLVHAPQAWIRCGCWNRLRNSARLAGSRRKRHRCRLARATGRAGCVASCP